MEKIRFLIIIVLSSMVFAAPPFGPPQSVTIDCISESLEKLIFPPIVKKSKSAPLYTYPKFFPKFKPSPFDHIRLSKKGLWEVLVPNKDGTFKIFKTKSLYEAKEKFQKFKSPLNLKEVQFTIQRDAQSLLRTLRNIDYPPNITFVTREKELTSLRNKIFDRVIQAKKKGEKFTFNDVHDIVGVRITTSSHRESKEVLKALRSKLKKQIKEVDEKDGPENPHKSGYQAFHLELRTLNGNPVEIQVMSKNMETWHSWDHQYVYKGNFSEQYSKDLRRYSKDITSYIKSLESDLPDSRGPPDFKEYGIREEHIFDFSKLDN